VYFLVYSLWTVLCKLRGFTAILMRLQQGCDTSEKKKKLLYYWRRKNKLLK
jgi:hypothetical protein